jgi:hypothetical protein
MATTQEEITRVGRDLMHVRNHRHDDDLRVAREGDGWRVVNQHTGSSHHVNAYGRCDCPGDKPGAPCYHVRAVAKGIETSRREQRARKSFTRREDPDVRRYIDAWAEWRGNENAGLLAPAPWEA